MSVQVAIIIGIVMGIVFGFALEKGRVFEPGVIVGQMQFRSFIMLKMFLTAVATSAIVLAVMNGYGLTKLHPKAAMYYADIVGGLLLGSGIALAGACPGTVLAQIGVGYKDALFTLLGGIVGAVVFSYFEPALKASFLGASNGKLTFFELAGVAYWQAALALVVVIVPILVILEKRRSWREELQLTETPQSVD